ncbi:MAG: glycoside hydrolase family 3 C-terminal domain-containing protein, partial [Defluviitaleaceae bacterium]|nr:glycoside hydrolase family 3 C-terminal domain-containing protein [Defluviitaleaceae bacterium]
NANITPRMKYDYYLKPFEIAAVEGGAIGLMTAYNCINGIEAINNPEVTEICKKIWGMIFTVSDGGDFGQNVAGHRSYKNHALSIADILGYGADLMLDSPEMVEPAIRDALRQGLLTEKQLNTAVSALLEVRFMLGDFDKVHPYTNMDKSKLACKEHKQAAVEAARKSVILLENNDFLPLKDDSKSKIAVLGPLSNENYRDHYCGHAENQTPIAKGFIEKLGESRVLFDECFDHIVIKSKKTGKYLTIGEDNILFATAATPSNAEIFELADWDFGSWTLRSLKSRKYVAESYGNAGNFNYPMRCASDEANGWFVMEVIKAECINEIAYLKSWQNREIIVDNENKLVSVTGMTHDNEFIVEVISSGIERAKKLAESADYALICAGNQPMINAREEYDRPDIHLPKSQSALLSAVSEKNANTFLYLVTGYPFAINKEKNISKAVLASTHLGPSLGHVAAETVFGENVPAGRTPATWYKSVRELPHIEDYDISKNNMTYLYFKREPLYPFGYGLSYTKFDYSSAAINNKNDNIIISLEVKNSGDFDADEVVQVYAVPAKSYLKRPLKMLKAFKRVHIKKGETAQISLTIPHSELAFWHPEKNAYIVDAGEYTFEIGASSSDIRARLTTTIDGEKIAPRNPLLRTEAIDTEDYSGLIFQTDKADMQTYVEGKGLMSYAVYPAFDLSNINAFEGLISSPCGTLNITIANNKTGEVLGNLNSNGTGSLSEFVPMTCEVKAQGGICDIRLIFTKHICIKSFRFIKHS